MDQMKSEFFWIDKSKIGKLYLYTIETGNNIIDKLGGKLKYYLQKKYNNNIFAWNKEKKLIVSDMDMDDNIIKSLLDILWNDKYFNRIKNIKRIIDNIDNISIAEYVVSFLNNKYNQKLEEYKNSLTDESKDIEIILNYNLRAWEIQNKPCISISVNKQILYISDLEYYYKNENKDLLNMQVTVIKVFSSGSSSTGKIVKVYGKIKDEGERLKKITKNNLMKRAIEKGMRETPCYPVVSVNFETDETYDYVMQSLKPVITAGTKLKNYNSTQIYNKLKIEPDKRYSIVLGIYEIIKKSGFLNGNVDNNEIFGHIDDNYIYPFIEIGNNKKIKYRYNFFNEIIKNGLFKKNDKFNNNTLKMAILNISGEDINKYIKNILDDIKKFDINPEIVLALENKEIRDIMDRIVGENPDILIFISGNDFTDKSYFNYKSMLLSHDIQSQHIKFETLDNRYSYANIILGIIGKTGNTPFILSNEKYADYIVGIDISREMKSNNKGTRNVAAMTRLYSYDGNMIRYNILTNLIDGETIPKDVLCKIYGNNEMKNKNVIFHRDGPFRGNEIKVLNEIAGNLKSDFHFIEINKRNAPRLYKINNKISNPDNGTYMKINDNEYIIVTSNIKSGTTRPLHVKLYNISFENAMKSIYNLLVMDYGSMKTPRIPVTIHYSDKIAYNALRGIVPKSLEGNIPFWL